MQELMIAAVLSQDPIMLQTFREPKQVLNEQGKLVDNARSDLHTLTARSAFAKVFTLADGTVLPETQWVARAKDESAITLPGTPRDYGKLLAAA
jgi:hypothetical protein